MDRREYKKKYREMVKNNPVLLEKRRAYDREYKRKHYKSKKKKVRGKYKPRNCIYKYTREYYEKVFHNEFKEEIRVSPIVIVDEWGNIIGYTKNKFYL